MTVKQNIPGGLVGYPLAGNAGALTVTFDPAATPAQLAADPTLFNSFSAMILFVSVSIAPVTVVFLGDFTVPAGTSSFPVGTSFIGRGDVFPTMTITSGASLRGVQIFHDLSIANTGSAGTIASQSDGTNLFLTFVGCEFNVTQYLALISVAETLVTLTSCTDASGGPIGMANPILSYSGANQYQLVLEGTVCGPNMIVTTAEAGTTMVILVGGGQFSHLQAQQTGSWSTTTYSNPQVIGSSNRQSYTIGADALWPTPVNAATQLQVGFLAVNNTTGGALKLAIGTNDFFTEGQLLYVRNISAAAGSTVALFQPDDALPVNSNLILDATIVPQAGAAGSQIAILLMFTRDNDAGSPGWVPISNHIKA